MEGFLGVERMKENVESAGREGDGGGIVGKAGLGVGGGDKGLYGRLLVCLVGCL